MSLWSGTRPGDTLASVGFLFGVPESGNARVLRGCLPNEDNIFGEGEQVSDETCPVPYPTFADDFRVMIAHRDPEELVRASVKLVDVMRRICERNALRLDMAKGRTEAVMALRSVGSQRVEHKMSGTAKRASRCWRGVQICCGLSTHNTLARQRILQDGEPSWQRDAQPRWTQPRPAAEGSDNGCPRKETTGALSHQRTGRSCSMAQEDFEPARAAKRRWMSSTPRKWKRSQCPKGNGRRRGSEGKSRSSR